VRSWEEQTAGRQANDGDDTIVGIQEHRVDGEAHPEGMYGPGTFEQESLVRRQSRPTEEAAGAVPPRFRDPHHP